MKCNSFHKCGGMTCIREKGHDGLCWSKAVRARDGSITRGEWHSDKNGIYRKHHRYATTYPTNARSKP